MSLEETMELIASVVRFATAWEGKPSEDGENEPSASTRLSAECMLS